MDFHSQQELIETPGASLEPSTVPSPSGVPGRRAAGLLSRQLQHAWGFPSSSPPHPAAGCSNIPGPGHLRLLWLLSKVPELSPRRGSGHPRPVLPSSDVSFGVFPAPSGLPGSFGVGRLRGRVGAWRKAEWLSRGRVLALGFVELQGAPSQRGPEAWRRLGKREAACPLPLSKGQSGSRAAPFDLQCSTARIWGAGESPRGPHWGVPPPGPSCSPSCCTPRGSSA